MENTIYSLYEDVLVEWLPGEWREGTITVIWEDKNKYLVKVKSTDIRFTVTESQIKKIKPKYQNQFFE